MESKAFFFVKNCKKQQIIFYVIQHYCSLRWRISADKGGRHTLISMVVLVILRICFESHRVSSGIGSRCLSVLCPDISRKWAGM